MLSVCLCSYAVGIKTDLQKAVIAGDLNCDPTSRFCREFTSFATDTDPLPLI